MGCCGNNSTVQYKHNMKVQQIEQKNIVTIKRWALGALTRRKVKKLVQSITIARQQKPVYENGKFKLTDEHLFTDEDLAYQLSY